ncbi:choice-of-anchor Q domain-containing protein [Wenzhouxiangella marina]|uniref:Uncharacterized protein n=1 Tax=Wenzhouxiangella marina TaxID=1579979 RepID=A0A0K0Y019_9GAMM|nr:choice-of-anchor Q domain-containing protein [Wenzhouxiangella marina]AKS43284.1 hypothetical protein WM2015_2929 [Wenzhouxiangella marina]MBB6087026.1 hypothetical protein [Wenzhouxiangella marina]
MNLDPGFGNTARGPYRLGPGSAAIDACSSAQVEDDLDGAGRPSGDGYDIGAFEAEVFVDRVFSDRFGG